MSYNRTSVGARNELPVGVAGVGRRAVKKSRGAIGLKPRTLIGGQPIVLQNTKTVQSTVRVSNRERTSLTRTFQEAMSEQTLLKVEGVSALMISFDMMVQMSVPIITVPSSDIGPGTVNDLSMGGYNNTSKCNHCGFPSCGGHNGRIVFPEGIYVYNPFFIKTVVDLLTVICHDCGSLLLPKKLLERFARLPPEQRLVELRKAVQKDKVLCTHKQKKDPKTGELIPCKPNLRILQTKSDKQVGSEKTKTTSKSVETGKIYFTNETDTKGKKKTKGEVNVFPISKAKQILENITPEALKFLGFNEENHPASMILRGILVIPPVVRPPNVAGNQTTDHDLTKHYISIVKKVKEIQEIVDTSWDILLNIARENPKLSKEIHSEDLSVLEKKEKLLNIPGISKNVRMQLGNVADTAQYVDELYQLIKNLEIGSKTSTYVTEVVKSLKDLVQGKNATFRGNMLGKRVNFCGRAVAGPDPTIPFWQIRIPPFVAERLTIPVLVTDNNIEECRQLIVEGKVNTIELPSIINQMGTRSPYKRVIAVERKISGQRININKYRINRGDIINRQMQDGDFVLVNRQPTLHKFSMMAYQVVIGEGDTFRINLQVTGPLNADFDGDELNLWVPQSHEELVEAREIMFAKKCITSTGLEKPSIGLTMDSLSGLYNLTKKETFVNPELFSQFVMFLTYQEPLRTLPARLTANGVAPFSGRSLFSTILPPNFTYKIGTIVIKDGVLIKGVTNSDTVGSGVNSMVMKIAANYSIERAADFINDAGKLAVFYNTYHPMTIGIRDCMDIVGVSKQKPEEVEAIMEELAGLKEKELAAEGSAKTLLGRRIMDISNKLLTGPTQKFKDVAESMTNNFFATSINSKAKGSATTAVQSSSIIGSFLVGGEFHGPDLIDGKNVSLPYAGANSIDPVNFGICTRSFLEGLTPAQTFIGAASARDNLIDTAQKTSIVGYIRRLLTKSVENIHLENDHTVRNNSGEIIQYVYGNDGLAINESTMVPSEEVGEVSFFIDLNNVIDNVNAEFGYND